MTDESGVKVAAGERSEGSAGPDAPGVPDETVFFGAHPERMQNVMKKGSRILKKYMVVIN